MVLNRIELELLGMLKLQIWELLEVKFNLSELLVRGQYREYLSVWHVGHNFLNSEQWVVFLFDHFVYLMFYLI